MNKVILSIGGMSCSACSSSLEKYLNKQEGIINASVNLVLAQVLIEYDDILGLDDLSRFVNEAGFESLGVYNNKLDKKKKSNDKISLVLIGILAVFILYIAMADMIHIPIISFLNMNKYPLNYALTLFILAIFFLIYGLDIFKSGVKNLFHKTPNMDTLVSLGVMASFLYSLFNLVLVILGKHECVHNLYFESCAMIIFFIKLGRFIDKNSKVKTKEAIKELVTITPSKGLLKTKNGEQEVTIDEIKKGDILIAKPGMKIAVDGYIVNGSSHLDEAFITGESTPVKKKEQDKVIAGSINYDGFILYKASYIGANSTISEIVRLVVEATNTKAPIARLADKVSSYFVPIIIILSILTFIGYLILGVPFKEAINTFVTVLVVACPCALGLATPMAIVVSVGVCAKLGILVKSSETLEMAHKIDTIIFDKTGTLTYGNLQIAKIYNYSKYSDDELIEKVASLEVKSTHPISKVFTEYAEFHNLKLKEIKGFKNIDGVGLEGTINNQKFYVGNNKLFLKLKLKNNKEQDEQNLTNMANSIVYVIQDNKIIGLIGVKDIVRDNAKNTISKLKRMGKNIIMLTGDNEKTAKNIADSIGVDKVIASVLPKDKTSVIKDLINDGKNVMMVGDGINDAPSLVASSIGVSVSSGTDIANDSADVILTHDNLDNIPNLINISGKTIKNIKENLFWAFFYNVLMVPIAIGLLKPFNISLNPVIASIAMMISSLTVVFNALRLKKLKGSKIK